MKNSSGIPNANSQDDRSDRLLLHDRDRLKARLAEVPREPGVYFFRDAQDRILYIGKSKTLRQRVQSYFRPFTSQTGRSPLELSGANRLHSPRLEQMVRQITEIEFIVTDTESEALALEANSIKLHQPYFNVLLKDDKKYPYLCITWSEDYPRIFITRKRRRGEVRDRYYGPYTDARSLNETLRLVKRLFPLRQRPKPLFKDRPCLNYDLGRCPGVCQGLVTPAAYRQIVQKVAMVFQGRSGELIATLTSQMAAAAEALNFEEAAQLRDRIRGLESLGADRKVELPNDQVSRDAIALASDGTIACVQLFQIRAGRLVGRLAFKADVPVDLGQDDLATEPIDPEIPETEIAATEPIDTEIGDTEIPETDLTRLGLVGTEDVGGPKRYAPTKGVGYGQILQRVIEEHYSQVEPIEIPAEILVQSGLPDQAWLADWLSDRRGRKVTIAQPQRQLKADLIALVERNAEYELARVRRSVDRNLAALEDLAQLLDLPDVPHWMECYDISHSQGSDAVASRVVFIDGLPAKQHYRHYKIRDPLVRSGHSDDFASLAEVVGRRFRDSQPPRLSNPATDRSTNRSTNPSTNPSTKRSPGRSTDHWPDLVVIDGGKGQLSAVVRVLEDLELLDELHVVSLAKQREEIFLPGESEPISSQADQPGVQLVRRLRDEAHRFAVSFHRQQRSQRMSRSRLEDIPGLGHHRQKLLLAHFRSIDYLRLATPKDLMAVPGIGPHLAETIHAYFHPTTTNSEVP